MRDVAAGGAAVDADARGVAAPFGGLRLDPAQAVVRVLDVGGVGRFAGQGHVDRHDHYAARRDRAVHRLFGEAVLARPGAAVQVEHHREGPRALRLVDAREELAAGGIAPERHVAHLQVELRRRIVGLGQRGGRKCRGCAERAEELQEVPTFQLAAFHGWLLLGALYTHESRIQENSGSDPCSELTGRAPRTPVPPSRAWPRTAAARRRSGCPRGCPSARPSRPGPSRPAPW